MQWSIQEIARLTGEEVATWPRGEAFALQPRLEGLALRILLRVVFGADAWDRVARLEPGFGLGSAARHLGAGAVEVGQDAASVRADVDDLADLGAALVAGVGPHTSLASGRRVTPQG